MDDTAQIVRRLDLIQATLALAFESELTAARDRIRGDDVSAAILDETEDWIGSTELQKRGRALTGKVERAIRNRLPLLVSQGALEVRSSGRSPEYRRTGLV
jgi:hypothetical protein